ncbi:MAG: hypothetical protein ACYCS7_15245 [Acidimicrobiales bacterium]
MIHSGDLKLDLNPVDGRHTRLARMGAISSGEGVRLYLGDSTNADEPGHSRSESTVRPVLEGLFTANTGQRVITTCFASHIHRVQQTAASAVANALIVGSAQCSHHGAALPNRAGGAVPRR